MLKIIHVIIFFTYFNSQSLCQKVKSNIITNGSFEDVYHYEYFANYVNDSSDNFFAKNWFIIQSTTPDLISISNDNKNLIQVVECGPSTATDGNNFIGLVVINESLSNEMIINRFEAELEKDSVYILEFNLFYNETCTKYNVTELNVCLSKEQPKNQRHYLFKPNNKINKKFISSLLKLYNSDELLYNKCKVKLDKIVLNKWNKIQLELQAKGGEKFITIGYIPILNKDEVNTIVNNKDLTIFNNVKKNEVYQINKYRFPTYYYFDDFKLYKK
jgi:hypothetical protein